MTFKQHWEKAELQQQLPEDVIDGMLTLAFPGEKIYSRQVISGGCANLNYRLELKSDKQPIILRIYLRDQEAAYREQKLGQLLKSAIPIPESYFVGEHQTYRFAIVEHLPGISLRDLLLKNPSQDFSSLLVDAGVLLTKIRQFVFERAGFFDRDLKITDSISQAWLLDYAQQCLTKPIVQQLLVPEVLNKIDYYLKKLGIFFPDKQEKNLVHADFDPANILVQKMNDTWQLSGILDWEFAFAGSSLCDVANMLRYAHHMPTWFEDSFLQGLVMSGYHLPSYWKISVHLLNLLSLLDCLVHSSDNRPNQREDIFALIDYILVQLSQNE